MDMKKQNEHKCFLTMKDYVKHHMRTKERKYFYSVFPLDLKPIQTEKPDFVFNSEGCSYALEHFMIDSCYDGPNNNQSQSKIASRDINKIYTKYHDNEIGTIKESDIEGAVKDLENEINKIFNFVSSFEYYKYVEAFKRVFTHHYSRLQIYKTNAAIHNNTVKNGFLIEFHCDTSLIKAMDRDLIVSFNSSQPFFPMTKDILDIFVSGTELDFIVVAQYREGIISEARDVKIYEPSNIEKSLEIQQIRVYDKVFYSNIKKDIKFKVVG